MIADFFRLAVRNIVHRKRRSWLTVIGIFIGIASVVALVSLGQGLQQSIEKEFQSIGGDQLYIQPGGGVQGGGAFSGNSAKLRDDDLKAVRRSRGVDSVAGVIASSARVEYHSQGTFGMVLGLPTDEGLKIVENSWSIEIDRGRMIRPTDRSNIVIGSSAADSMFDQDLGVRSKVYINSREFRVVGVMKPTGDPSVDRSIVMPIDRAREVLGKQDTYDWIFAKMQKGFSVTNVEENVKRSLRQERGVKKGEEDFTIQTPQDLISSFSSILSLVNGVVVGIASISLLVGGVGIMNTMYTSVTERTREIGVMKAVGATKNQILALFLLESGMIGLIGGGIGVLVGLGLAVMVAHFATQATNIAISASFSPVLIGGSLLFSFFVGTLSGILPARRAANLQPAEALRYE